MANIKVNKERLEKIEKAQNALFEKYKPNKPDDLFNIFKDTCDEIVNGFIKASNNDWDRTNYKIKGFILFTIGITLASIFLKNHTVITMSIVILIINLFYVVRLYFATKNRIKSLKFIVYSTIMEYLNVTIDRFVYEKFKDQENPTSEMLEKEIGIGNVKSLINKCNDYVTGLLQL